MPVTHDGHRSRVRQEFLDAGLDSFPDHKILELLLYPVIPRKDTNPIAHELIQTFGSFSGVLDASYEDLLKVKGIGESAAVLIKMIPGIFRRYLTSKEEDGIVLDSTEAAGEYVRARLLGYAKEVVYLVCLDSRRKVLLSKMVSEGSVHAAEVNIRLMAEMALRSNAAMVIVAHNHPNGLALPSSNDITTTQKMIRAFELLGVNMVDHIIVSDTDFVSLADSGQFSAAFRW